MKIMMQIELRPSKYTFFALRNKYNYDITVALQPAEKTTGLKQNNRTECLMLAGSVGRKNSSGGFRLDRQVK